VCIAKVWSSGHMLRRPALAALLLCALPSSALANPSFSVSSTAAGGLKSLPARVSHRLTVTAGPAQETFHISALGSLAVSGNTLSVDQQTAVGPPVFTCGTRWQRPHEPFGQRSAFGVRVTLAPFATAFVDTATTLRRPPWAGDLLDATWELAPAQGSPFDVVSTAPDYAGPSGVELAFALTRVSARRYAVTGTAAPEVASGRVQLWGYPPGRKHAIRLAGARVRDGAWSIPRLRPSRGGRWELYARYRTTSRAYADDASVCGTVVRVH
jgi:hypothetical protein